MRLGNDQNCPYSSISINLTTSLTTRTRNDAALVGTDFTTAVVHIYRSTDYS